MKKFNVLGPVVIMCGISGSGKTHYARILEKDDYIRLSTDTLIWEKVGSNLFSLSKEKQKQLFSECMRHILDMLECHLISGKKVVVDATHCKRAVRDEIRNLCAKLDINPIFLFCDADEKELWNRLSKRKGSGPDDLLVTRDELAEYCRGFERPATDEKDFIFIS